MNDEQVIFHFYSPKEKTPFRKIPNLMHTHLHLILKFTKENEIKQVPRTGVEQGQTDSEEPYWRKETKTIKFDLKKKKNREDTHIWSSDKKNDESRNKRNTQSLL